MPRPPVVSLVNTRHYRGLSDMDRPYTMNLAFVYDLPFGKGKSLARSGLLSMLAGGWSVSPAGRLAGSAPKATTGWLKAATIAEVGSTSVEVGAGRLCTRRMVEILLRCRRWHSTPESNSLM